MPAPENNQNAVKDEADVSSSFLHVRVVPSEKAAWVKAAKRRNKKLTNWTTEMLNHAAKETATGEPRVKTLLRSMLVALDRDDADTYWVTFEMLLSLHEEMTNTTDSQTSTAPAE